LIKTQLILICVAQSIQYEKCEPIERVGELVLSLDLQFDVDYSEVPWENVGIF
jgi:hypothetical protein